MTRNGKDVIASLYERYKDIDASIDAIKMTLFNDQTNWR